MSLDKLVHSICKTAFFYLRNIGSIRNMLTDGDDACSQLIHSLVTVCINYFNFLLFGMPNSTLFRLLLVFFKKNLNFLTLLTASRTCIGFQVGMQCISFKIILLTYQAYHNTAPKYLCESLM